jgi:hypothetical protein
VSNEASKNGLCVRLPQLHLQAQPPGGHGPRRASPDSGRHR